MPPNEPGAKSAGLAPLLHECVESGRFEAVGELLGDETVFDSSSERGRHRLTGADAIIDHLGAPGPGDVLEWDAQEWDEGVAITFEWRGASGTDRRRWYLRRIGPRIAGWWSYAARPVSERADQAEIPAAVIEQVGAGARRMPILHSGNSGAALERITAADGSTLIAKRVGGATDWLGRVTGDRGRTALLWESGAFSRMPAQIDHGIERVVPDGDGWWVLMRDLSHTFLVEDRRLSRVESRRILDAAAAMHAEFAGDVPAGAADLSARLGMSSLRVVEAERSGPDLLPKQLEAAWDAFADAVPAELAAVVMSAVRDPLPLAAAIDAAGPSTLLHGDLRDDNLGLDSDRIVLIDWDLATAGAPAVEFAWFLCHDAWRVDATHDELEADFRAAERNLLDDRAAELGMLTGLVQYGWIFGHSLRVHPDPAEQSWARAELDWWVPRTRLALDRLGGIPG